MKPTISKRKIIEITFALVILDQALLPMLQISGAPVKPSYILILIVSVFFFGAIFKFKYADNKIPIYLFLLAILNGLGLIFLYTQGTPLDPFSTFRAIVQYLLMAMSAIIFHNTKKINSRILLISFYGAATTLLILSIFYQRFPNFTEFWLGADTTLDLDSTKETRPTPFGDGSMIMTTTLMLIITLAQRQGFIFLKEIEKYGIILTSLSLAIILSSRNQLISITLMSAFLLFNNKKYTVTHAASTIGSIIAIIALLISFVNIFEEDIPAISYSISRLTDTVESINSESKDSEEDSILRPLVRFDRFYNRFIESPIFGSSSSLLSFEPYSRLNFHNDIFHILATTGIIGGYCYIMLIIKIYKRLGFISIIPFFLPGLTNSFILHISASIIYISAISFFMGNLEDRKQQFMPPIK